MINIEMQTHELITLINNLRDEARHTEVDRDLKEKARRYEEDEKEISEAHKLIDDSSIFQKTNEPISNKVARIMTMLERYNRQLEEIEKYVDESKLCFDNTRDIAYKVNEIVKGCNDLKHGASTKEYQGKQLAKYESLIQDAIQAAKKHESQNVIDILNKRMKDDEFTVLAAREKRVFDAIEAIKKNQPQEARSILEGATFHCLEEFCVDCFIRYFNTTGRIFEQDDVESFKEIVKEKLNCK